MQHPWFGSKVAYLLVFRSRYDGRRERWTICSDKIEPGEIENEIAVREKFGPGRYRVEGRDEKSHTCGAPQFVEIEDKTGVVPGSEEAFELAARERAEQKSAPNAIEIVMAAQREQLAAVQRDRAADMAFFSSVVEKMTGNQPRDDRFSSFLQAEKDRLHRENETLRRELEASRESTNKLRLRAATGEDSWLGELVREVGPSLVGVFSARKKEASESQAGKPEKSLEPAGEKEGVSVPTAAEVASYLRSGGVLTFGEIERFRRLDAAGALSPELSAIVSVFWGDRDGGTAGAVTRNDADRSGGHREDSAACASPSAANATGDGARDPSGGPVTPVSQ